MSLLPLHSFKRIVVKIGSALLVDKSYGLKRDWLESLSVDIARLTHAGVEILLVSSGAIALGRTVLRLPTGSLKLEESQACAAVGQIELSKAYADVLGRHSLTTAQILLTLGDTEERRRYLNARATLETLLRFKAIPVINENDSVATSEIRYGDNDRLAARVATMMRADLLILLSDIDGLYTAPPHLDLQAKLIPIVEKITTEIEAMAGAAASEFSRGGMKTKIDAGKIATTAGTAMIITSGKRMNPLHAIDCGKPATLFKASPSPISAWKTWIAGNLEPSGVIEIDAGAVQALGSGKSLLPAGVKNVTGQFERGDTVSVVGVNGIEIARGLIAYDAIDAISIAGQKTSDILRILGYEPRAAMIHRDDLVLTKHGIKP
jgi:glutamate 5-kinase